MNNLTKEQIRLFSIIAGVLMLIAFFIPAKIDFFSISFFDMLFKGEFPVGFWGTIALIIMLLMPIYIILYAFKDEKALEPIKPILGLSPKIVYVMPICFFILLLLVGSMYAGITPLWIYVLAGLAVYFIGMKSQQ